MAEYQESLFDEIADIHKRAFLAAFAHTGRLTRAAKAAQINWRNHYYWIKSDPVYAEAFAVAKLMAGDFLEDEAIRRAVEGIQKPIFHHGVHVDNATEYSDALLIFTLKGAKPEKYRERYEHTGKDGGPMAVNVVRLPVKAASTEEWKAANLPPSSDDVEVLHE